MALSRTDVIRTGAFLARTVYGGEDLPAAYRGALTGGADPLNYDDDYRGYIADQSPAGETWRVLAAAELGPSHFDAPLDGGFSTGGLYLSANSDGNAGEVLIVEAVIDGEKTLFIVFRGSDGEDAVTEGQTFTKDGVTTYYLLIRPVILAAADYAAANGIENVVVSGHSLGGTMVDVFALADSDLFPGMSVYLVSLASAGVVPNLSDNAALLGLDLSNSTLGPAGQIAELGLPGAVTAYYAINHTEDRVYHSLPASAPGMTPNFVLYDNVHSPGATEIDLPNIDNTDVDYQPGPGTAYGFGAEHAIGLYWSNIDALTRDPLYAHFTTQAVIMGVNSYATATQDYNGTPFPAFLSFTGGPGAEIDNFGQALEGTAQADYILGLAGDDLLRGMAGADLLSGGPGADEIFGDAGTDRIHGGDGDDSIKGGSENDTIDGGAGDDFIHGQNGVDMINGGDGADTITGNNGEDTITGDAGEDLVKGGFNWDHVHGGPDDDTVMGQNGNDTVYGGGGGDFVRGNNGNDVIHGESGNDLVDGGPGNDLMRGGANNDTLIAGPGRDTLVGGAGDDELTGGNGDDLFVFNPDLATGHDTVTDFEDGLDTVRINGSAGMPDLTITTVGPDTLVTWDGGAVTLENTAGLIDEDDFTFG